MKIIECKCGLGIIVRISGQVKCQFVEVSGERFITHVGEETYIQEDIYVLGNDSGKYI